MSQINPTFLESLVRLAQSELGKWIILVVLVLVAIFSIEAGLVESPYNNF